MVVFVLGEGGEANPYKKFVSPNLLPICNTFPLFCVTHDGGEISIVRTIDVERSGSLKMRGIDGKFTCLIVLNGVQSEMAFYTDGKDWYVEGVEDLAV